MASQSTRQDSAGRCSVEGRWIRGLFSGALCHVAQSLSLGTSGSQSHAVAIPDLAVLSLQEVSPISSNKAGCYGKPGACFSRTGPSPLLWNHPWAPSKCTFPGLEPGSLGLRLPPLRILMHPKVCNHCSPGLAESLFTLMVEGLTGGPGGAGLGCDICSWSFCKHAALGRRALGQFFSPKSSLHKAVAR